ncbi:MAG: aminotransferase class I/II-fold pyridoxal phosphate-dependent enzyme [Deltaproteobacteria bacterium]|nr:aminotransferase class I/II-fold pyridoxal phosphate-dependent enzyme [Deltaproteobacteria bacterium]
MNPIDLRSDTVTRPTPAMRRAMAEAEVGDDVFGDDPTVIALQERVAGILGKEAALFVPSGTMANQIALAVLGRSGDEVYCDRNCHLFNYESGSPAFIARVQLQPLDGERGVFTAAQVEAALRPPDHHHPPSAVVAVENSHNRGGGTVWPLPEMQRISALCRERGLGLHLDGARLWNAAAASGVAERVWAGLADTVNVCFSKGLGAPVGSALAGTRELMDEAHRMRKRLGGGMRQAGIIAAGALHALDFHRDRLSEDHRRARRLAEGLAEIRGFDIDPERVETNIAIVDFTARGIDASVFAAEVKSRGLLVTLAGRHRVRLVTHLDIGDRDIEAALEIVHGLYG